MLARTSKLGLATSPRKQAGFTLVELIISMLLLSALVSAIAYGMSLSLDALERQRNGQAERRQAEMVVMDLLREQLFSALPYKNPTLSGKSFLYFKGSEKELRFVTLAPARLVSASTGMVMVWYRVDDKKGVFYGERIVTNQDLEHLSGGRKEEGELILDFPVSFSFRADNSPRWQLNWSGKRKGALPVAVKLDADWDGRHYQRIFEVPVAGGNG